MTQYAGVDQSQNVSHKTWLSCQDQKKKPKTKQQRKKTMETDFYLLSTIPGLHGVRVEQPYDSPLFSLPELFVNFSKQEQRHVPCQVTEIIQSPDTKCFPLEQIFILIFTKKIFEKI